MAGRRRQCGDNGAAAMVWQRCGSKSVLRYGGDGVATVRQRQCGNGAAATVWQQCSEAMLRRQWCSDNVRRGNGAARTV